MPNYDVVCKTCGREFEAFARYEQRHEIPCPCGGATELLWRANPNSRHADVTWPGGKTFTNGFDTPTTFYSPREYAAALKAKGLKVRGDGEEQFGWMSRETLKQAEELVKRCS